MKVRLFATGISTNVRGEEHPVCGFINFSTLLYGVISINAWSELSPDEAKTKAEEIKKVQPQLTVKIEPIPEDAS